MKGYWLNQPNRILAQGRLIVVHTLPGRWMGMKDFCEYEGDQILRAGILTQLTLWDSC